MGIKSYDAFPSSIFFCIALAEWYIMESIKPATAEKQRRQNQCLHTQYKNNFTPEIYSEHGT